MTNEQLAQHLDDMADVVVNEGGPACNTDAEFLYLAADRLRGHPPCACRGEKPLAVVDDVALQHLFENDLYGLTVEVRSPHGGKALAVRVIILPGEKP